MVGDALPTPRPVIDLVEALGRMSARAVVDAGIELDVDDPRVARWLMLTALESLVVPGARSPASKLVAMVEDATLAGPAPSGRKRRKPALPHALGWDDLKALTEPDQSSARAG